MTKIYLVKLEAWNTKSKSFLRVVINVFTNKKKAKIYAEYKQLLYETEKPSYLTNYEKITIKVDEFKINNYDWSKDLLKLQTKNLPY